jgi:radical SAM superfamily enzyme YgiQ (UPF0313 family)
MFFRMIVPAHPRKSVFTGQAKRTTALGPLIVATVVSNMLEWIVEVIDENNWNGPRAKDGLPDHERLQRENPADVVGFYCGLTSTIKRVWELAKFYHNEGAFIIAGGWHAHSCPEETLSYKINVVVHGDGEEVICQLLDAYRLSTSIGEISGISFINNNGEIQRNSVDNKLNILRVDDLDGLPIPDFDLVRDAKITLFPIGRVRGCDKYCDFCIVRGKLRWASAGHLYRTVVQLVKKHGAKHFFITDDRSDGDRDGTKEFFEMIAKDYNKRLHFTTQNRLELADDLALMKVMRSAGVRVVCVGIESCIDEDLKAMKKGYSSEKILDWVKILHDFFWVHAMFIVGYPAREPEEMLKLSADQIAKRFRRFIRKAKLRTVQVMLPGPGMGTGLRRRLEKEGRLLPLDVVDWDCFDGGFVCFIPDDNMSVRELQELPMKIMGRFYNLLSFFRIPWKFVSFWTEDWGRELKGSVIRFGGHFLVRQGHKEKNVEQHLARIKAHID